MLTLHGFSYSNYYNMVKHAMLLKSLHFEENLVYPNEPALMEITPTGKVPALTTEQGGCILETSVILEYLEEAYPDTPLLPADPEARARVRELMKIAELYLDLSARRLTHAFLTGTRPPQATREEVRTVLERGLRSLSALASFTPYLTGPGITLADICLRYALVLPKLAGPSQLEWDIVAEVDGLAEWEAMMADSDIARRIDADQEANAAGFRAYISKLMG